MKPFHRTCCLLLLFLLPAGAWGERVYPVDFGRVTSVRGWRSDPFKSGSMKFHHGWDIAVPVGTPVKAVRAGRVYHAGPYGGFGQLVVLDHRNGFYTLYGHNSRLRVLTGQEVSEGAIVAESGTSGRSTGPHVHYEVRFSPTAYKSEEPMEAPLEEWITRSLAGAEPSESEL